MIEPEKFIHMENTFAGKAATGLFRADIASAPAIPPFCMPTSIATVLASASPNGRKRPSSLVSQYPLKYPIELCSTAAKMIANPADWNVRLLGAVKANIVKQIPVIEITESVLSQTCL